MNLAPSQHLIKFALSQFKRNTNSEGFTLVELLVAASLIPIIILLASQIFTSQVNSERSLLAAQSSENLRSRLSFLIESDISDGEEILASSDVRCPEVTGKIFSIRSPFLSSGLLQYACITYTQSGGNLLRIAPPNPPQWISKLSGRFAISTSRHWRKCHRCGNKFVPRQYQFQPHHTRLLGQTLSNICTRLWHEEF